MWFWTCALWMALGLGLAAPPEKKPDEASPEASDAKPKESKGHSDGDNERVTGKKPPPLKLGVIEPIPLTSGRGPMTYAEYGEQEYDNTVYIGANVLGVKPEFVHLVREGLTLIYRRDYNEARDHFTAVEEKYPHTGLAAVADTLVWQALMLENFDFRYDQQYWVSTKQAREDLGRAMEVEGQEGWEHFLMGGIVGIESIHTMRKSQYLQALQLAFNAMDHIQTAREKLPDFVDMRLADGMYNYWRSVVTMNSRVLPDFGDHRVQGLEDMVHVERQGIFLSAPATMSLAFSWIEEGNYKNAITACNRNRKKYPKNIINNLITGSVFVYMKRPDDALKLYDKILEVDPDNRRVRYWRGLAYMRSARPKLAEAEFVTYLAFDHLEDFQRGAAHYRLGQVNARRENWPKAVEHYKAAVKASGHKSAKAAIERLKDRKKKGKIDF